MKKILSAIIIIGLTLGTVGCGNSNKEDKTAELNKKYDKLKNEINKITIGEGANAEETKKFDDKKKEITKLLKDQGSTKKYKKLKEELLQINKDIATRIEVDKRVEEEVNKKLQEQGEGQNIQYEGYEQPVQPQQNNVDSNGFRQMTDAERQQFYIEPIQVTEPEYTQPE